MLVGNFYVIKGAYMPAGRSGQFPCQLLGTRLASREMGTGQSNASKVVEAAV